MARKLLDIAVQHDINSFLYEALPLCVVLSRPNLYGWFLNHYVDLYLCSAKKQDVYHYYRVRHAECNFYFGYSKLDEVIATSLVESKVIRDKLGIVDFLKANIDAGNYALVFLNEWAIPQKTSYHRNHWYHESLVYGYDDQKGVFHCISFDARRTFTSFPVDYRDFAEGFNMICDDPGDIGPYLKYVRLLRPSPHTYTFDLDRFRRQLDAYIAGKMDWADRCNLDLVDLSTPRDCWEYTFGCNICDKLVDIFRHPAPSSNYVDSSHDVFHFFEYYDFHILYEHKRLMRKRLDYINENLLPGRLDALLPAYAGVVDAFDRLRFLNIKFNAAPATSRYGASQAGPYAEKAVRLLQEAGDRERDVMEKIRACLWEKGEASGGAE